jgi:hypothetical protein
VFLNNELISSTSFPNSTLIQNKMPYFKKSDIMDYNTKLRNKKRDKLSVVVHTCNLIPQKLRQEDLEFQAIVTLTT